MRAVELKQVTHYQWPKVENFVLAVLPNRIKAGSPSYLGKPGHRVRKCCSTLH